MSWPSGTVPADVTALRAMLLASASYVAAGGTSGKIHFPTVDLTAVTFPAALITRESNERTAYAAGSDALPSGTLTVDLMVAGSLAGDAEDLANAMAQEIAAQTTGLAIRSVTAGIASDPEPSKAAAIADTDAKEYCTVQLLIHHGLSV